MILLFGLFVGLRDVVYAEPLHFAGQKQMNGYKLEDFKDFEKNWHFITVRFRQDTKEMRFEWANDKAWEALIAKRDEYPDGAIFAKIGVATDDDVAFPSSAVPTGARRYQFMIRDKVLYNDTQGWGYVLFDSNGLTFGEDPKKVKAACAACHQLVPERGYVFSRPLIFPGSIRFESALSTERTYIKFSAVKRAALPASIQRLIPAKQAFVRMVGGDMRKNLFLGTLDEIRPALAKEAAKARQPALLLSEDGLSYSLIYSEVRLTCPDGEAGYKSISSLNSQSEAKNESTFCSAK